MKFSPPLPLRPLMGGEVVPRWSTERPEALTVHENECRGILRYCISNLQYKRNFRHSLQRDHKMQNEAVTQPFSSTDDVSYLSVLLPTQINSKTQIRQCYLSVENKKLNNQIAIFFFFF